MRLMSAYLVKDAIDHRTRVLSRGRLRDEGACVMDGAGHPCCQAQAPMKQTHTLEDTTKWNARRTRGSYTPKVGVFALWFSLILCFICPQSVPILRGRRSHEARYETSISVFLQQLPRGQGSVSHSKEGYVNYFHRTSPKSMRAPSSSCDWQN